MSKTVLTKSQARRIILLAAGLAKPAQFGNGKEAAFKLIEHLGFVQIDSNYVVERAHHHVMAARIPDYKNEWLDELQADGRIFEYYTYALGYMPMDDFRFSLPVKASFLSKRKSLPQVEVNVMNKVLDRIAREGPLMARDFENDRITASTGWWDWRPSKLALERLHLDGRLMGMERRDFQKVFDLPKNIVPSDIDTTVPTEEEFAKHVILRALKALGIAYVKDIAWRARYVKNSIKTELPKLVESGEICMVEIEGPKASPLYMLPGYEKKKIILSDEAFIFSPFDVLNVLRHRLRDFFDFDYQVECFVPAPKRKYGYFSLPVLIGDTFVARMDCKADRKKKVLNILNLHFEDVKITMPQMEKIGDAINNFAKFNQCQATIIKKSNDTSHMKAIQAILL